MTTKSTTSSRPVVISVAGTEVPASYDGIDRVTVQDSRSLRRRLRLVDRAVVVVIRALEDLGDGDSSQALIQSLEAIETSDAAVFLVDERRLLSRGELDGAALLARALRTVRSTRIRHGQRRSPAREGRPRVVVAVEEARRVRAGGGSWREAAVAAGSTISTVRRRLQEGTAA